MEELSRLNVKRNIITRLHQFIAEEEFDTDSLISGTISTHKGEEEIDLSKGTQNINHAIQTFARKENSRRRRWSESGSFSESDDSESAIDV